MSLEPTPAERSARPDCSALDAIVHYYACFNARRFTEAANLFAASAVVEHIPGRGPQSREGYLQFAHAWVTAFPDVILRVEQINPRSDRLFDVDLVSSGTHRGDLDFAMYRFRPSGVKTTLRLRELLDVREARIFSSVLSFDLNDLVRQLSVVDVAELVVRLDQIGQLTEALNTAFDLERRQKIVDQLGPALDAARRVVRPYYYR